jgi:hypothetical protein
MPLSPEEIAATLAANERYERSERRTTWFYVARNVLVALALAWLAWTAHTAPDTPTPSGGGTSQEYCRSGNRMDPGDC